ncbi:MAG: ABC transporter permease, partial [Clostridia bacterium]|nr:ABC transporter permease [Clostridia bacterium]
MFKIVKKPEGTALSEILISILAVVFALVAAGAVMGLLGYNPFEVYKNMVDGALGSDYRIRATMNKAIPLTVLSLGVSVAYQMKFWNIGAEGQMAMGGIFTTWVALNCAALPRPLLLPFMLLAGIAGGALWALIPALLKVRLGTN